MQLYGFVLCATFVVYINAYPALETDLIAQPKPGQEYVFVQSSGTGARPIARKDKFVDESKHRFETSHKFPPSLKYILHDEDDDDCGDKKTKYKKTLEKREAPAPAPAGAIKLDVRKLLEKYKTELKTSTTVAPKTTANRRKSGNKRTKKEARFETELVTSPKPFLTTSASAPKPIDDDDIPIIGSASENQRSRIQIKKGPNGQEYEYEYVYYYYDDDDSPKTSNSHDGPSREQIKETKKDRKAEANEIVPSRGRTRGRQLSTDDETVNEERLPANTRFPPRSRNLNTTPLPEEETKTTTTTTTAKGRGRGRSTTEAVPTEADNVSDETQGSRGRTRANVRRPSLDLVDNESFNTAGADSAAASSPSFPSDLPAGPVRFLGATPNEQVDLPESALKSEEAPETGESNKNSDNVEEEEEEEEDSTTTMSPMDKVALDLYAILQGTQKLSGEEPSPTNVENLADTTEEAELTTEITTEAIIETTTPTTTTTATTTTTTTTPAPTTTTTTTTTTQAPLGRGRFKGRGRKTTSPASTTEAPQTETKPKSKYSRPSFGSRPRNRATTEASVEKEAKEETKPQTHARPTLSRGRFGGGRTRTRTTAAPEEKEETPSPSSSSPAPVARPALTRPRSSFNIRNRAHTTAAPTTEASEETSQESSTAATTAKPRRIQPGPGVRPLRPGPRINLARGRPGATTTTTTEAPVEDHVTGDETNGEEQAQPEEHEEKVEESAAAPVDNSPLAKLRNKQKLQIRPKAAASTSVQVRRINPLLRRRPGQPAAETSSETPAPEAVSSESPASGDEDSETEESLASSTTTTTTTEEPRGLNKLLAGRRRLATRAPARS